MESIPTALFRSIKGEEDPSTHSCIYTHSYTGVLEPKHSILTSFKLPYVQDCFWTAYKVLSPQDLNVHIEFVLVTDEGYTYKLMKQDFKQGWTDFDWPIPATIGVQGEKVSGVYVYVITHSDTPVTFLQVKLAGYYNLFPSARYYVLCNRDYEYVFTNHDEGDKGQCNVAYNVEHQDYIRHILDESHLIYTTQTYCHG